METGVWAAALVLLTGLSLLAGATLGGLRRAAWKNFRLLRGGLALAVGLDVGLLFLLGRRLAGPLLPGAPEADLWLGGACLLAALPLYFCPFSLFPEDSGALVLAGRTQQRRFTACLLRLAAGFLFFGGWLIFLLAAAPCSPFGPVSFCFAAAALPGLLWSGRLSIRTAYERVETLVDRQYQAELLNFMQVIRSQRHDFNFHMQAVAGMIESERFDECARYVREMVKNVERLNEVLPLKDPVISALINTFQELAASRRIRLEVQVLSQLEGLPCTNYEINSILGNLLQNAIDEVEENPSDRRWIKLLIMKRSRRSIIRVSNPCGRPPEEYSRVFQPGYSTKRSHEGIGLASVRRIAAKYGGTVYLEHDPGVIHFIAKLPEQGG